MEQKYPESSIYLSSDACGNWTEPYPSPLGGGGIEMVLHWISPSDEDTCRIRTGHAPQILLCCDGLPLMLLNPWESFKHSNRQKSNRATMDAVFTCLYYLLLVYLNIVLNPLSFSILRRAYPEERPQKKLLCGAKVAS